MTVGPKVPERSTGQSGHILVVDDNADNRAVLSRRLTRRGYRIDEAVNGSAALERIAGGGIDLVLLDVNMPGMNGLEVLAQVRQRHSPVELPVIMVTANGQGDDILRAIQADANDYVVKPVDFEPLVRRIETHLARRRAELALRISEERFALALRGSNVGLWDWDRESGAVYFAPAWKQQLGEAEDGGPTSVADWFERVHPDDRARLGDAMGTGDPVARGATLQIDHEYRIRHRDGDYRWMRIRGGAYAASQTGAGRVVGFQVDVSDRKLVDPLTALPNRMQFLDLLDATLSAAPSRPAGVALINIDRFRLINESLGAAAGDALLKGVAERLRQGLGADHVLARLGGDEFALLAHGVETDADMHALVAALEASFAPPLPIGEHELHVSFRVGAVIAGPAHRRAGDLLHHADLALRRAKQRPDVRIAFAERPAQGAALSRLLLENQLRRGLGRDEFTAAFHPIVDLATGRTVGFEALARWHQPDRGEVSPGRFIGIAEETGMIGAIDDRVLGFACREAARWPGRPFVTVNVSGRRFADPSLSAAIDTRLTESRLDPARLKLEITESTIMTDAATAASTVKAIVARGIGVAIDDFGTGYSSLAYLHRFAAKTLKIDQSFVRGMMASEQGLEIVRTIIVLARNLQMVVVAEGVETEAQRDALRALGCDYGQGYYFAKPLSAEDALRRLLAEAPEVAVG